MKAPPMSWIDEIFHLTAWTRKRVAIRQQNQCALIGCLNQCELKKSFQNWVKKNWRGTDDNLALVHTLDIPNRVFGYRTAYCWCGSLALVDCGAVCNRLLSQTCLPPACLNESMCRLCVHVLQYHPIQEAEKTYCHQAQANPLETQWRCTRCFRKVFKHFPQCLSKTVTSHRPAVGTERDGTGPGGTRYTASTISTLPVLSQGPVRWKIWRLLEVSSRWAGTLPPLEGARLTVGIPETQRANG